jgi:hypothetical protein
VKRPDLRPIPLAEVLPLGTRPALVMTMGASQWDVTLQASYDAGFVLLELDKHEQPIAAYQRAAGGVQ